MVNSIVMSSVHDEIKPSTFSQKHIIKAESIFNKFNSLVGPLLLRAKDNYNAISVMLNAMENVPKDFYAFKRPDGKYDDDDNLGDVNTRLIALKNKLNECETNWNDIAIGFDSESLSNTNPLHVQSEAIGLVRASGKVRKNDIIAAYNFKAFLQSLYAIVSELRDISFSIIDPKTKAPRTYGNQSRFDSYANLNSRSNDVSSTYILTQSEINNSYIYDFNDFIVNNNTNGKPIYTPDEISTNIETGEVVIQDSLVKHGHVGSSLIPSKDQAEILGNSGYINKNISSVSNFGHQTVSHLQLSDISSFLNSYYNVPSRIDNTFDYVSNPSTGIANEYLSLKPAGYYNSQNSTLDNWQTINDSLSSFFNPDSSRKNKILSGTSGQKQVVKANTINALFREMNKLFVQISATLCGEYEIYDIEGNVKQSNLPLAGLGYPEVFSWYYGTTEASKSLTQSDVDLCNDIDWGSDITSHNSDDLRKRTGLLSNGNQLAVKEYSSNTAIRAGLPYYKSIDEARITALNDFVNNIVEPSKSSVVPMTYNHFKIETTDDETIGNSIDVSNDVSTPEKFKEYMLTHKNTILPHKSYTVHIRSGILNDIKKYMFNRYCLSNPIDLDAYYDDITADLAKKNVNTKYIYMPYMTWFSYWSSRPSGYAIFNGTIPYYDEDAKEWNGEKEIYISSPSSVSGTINNAAGIPVLYETRENLWNQNAIVLTPESDASKLGTTDSSTGTHYGTVQLKMLNNENVAQRIDQNYTVNWFEYVISCGLSINEVNHTHPGMAITYFQLTNDSDTISANISSTYSTSWNDRSILTANTTNETVAFNKILPGITSTLKYASNNYVKSDLTSDISNDLSYSIFDMMSILYGNQYKFNDFYEDYNPIAINSLPINSLKSKFIAGSDNDYIKNNVTKVITWKTQISSSVSDIPTFNIIHNFNQDLKSSENGSNALETDEPNIIQGNFFLCANQSNNVKANGQSYKYHVIPQPDPIFVKTAFIQQPGIFMLNATCNSFWNNIKQIKLYLASKNPENTNISTMLTMTLNDSSTNDNASNNRPYVSSNVKDDYILFAENDENQYASIKKDNEDENVFSIEMMIDLQNVESTLLTELSSGLDCLCALRFINENDGFRDVCEAKSTSEISSNSGAGMFKIQKIGEWNQVQPRQIIDFSNSLVSVDYSKLPIDLDI